MKIDRRQFLRTAAGTAGSAAALAALPPAIAKALSIQANNRTGTLQDVEHVVCMMMENRSFDHYFGSMPGVRGFADPFPIPVPDTALLQGKTVWFQRNDAATGTNPKILTVQHNDTAADFRLMRTADTPHLYPDAQQAWDSGRMTSWPQFKNNASMVHYEESDIPFQFALANAFTLCDANHSAFTGGTNPNRCFFFTGTNHGHDDPTKPGVFNGPAMDNSYNALTNGTVRTGYTWTTYPERLEAAGVSWQVYQNEEVEFFALNSLLGFKTFRDANAASVPTVSPSRTTLQQALYEKGIRTRDVDLLKADVMAGTLPQVSWICPTASGSEHPSSSSPASGAGYIAKVLDALTSNPDVWSKTVLIINFDENDGFFDHVAPPAPPSYVTFDPDPAKAVFAGATNVDASDEYLGTADGGITTVDPFIHHPFGLGPRVPMYIVSPWSRGGWVDSQVFDQTSTIRFIEKRFGVQEPNISTWRRAVVGDLMSCFDFANPNDSVFLSSLPDTIGRDTQSRALPGTTTPRVAPMPVLPTQAQGPRKSRALPYELHADALVMIDGKTQTRSIQVRFGNTGSVAAVFHVYDRLALTQIPRRYTVDANKGLVGTWTPASDGAYDLWIVGPNGFHRHCTGNANAVAGNGQPNPAIAIDYDRGAQQLRVQMKSPGPVQLAFTITANAYFPKTPTTLPPGENQFRPLLAATGGWYDFSLTVDGLPGFSRRFAGRMETGADSISDPAMFGTAIGDQFRVGG